MDENESKALRVRKPKIRKQLVEIVNNNEE
jgi:hypothetical protein